MTPCLTSFLSPPPFITPASFFGCGLAICQVRLRRLTKKKLGFAASTSLMQLLSGAAATQDALRSDQAISGTGSSNRHTNGG